MATAAHWQQQPQPTDSATDINEDGDEDVQVEVEVEQLAEEQAQWQQEQRYDESPPPTAPASGRPAASPRSRAHAAHGAHAASAAPPPPQPAVAAAPHSPRWNASSGGAADSSSDWQNDGQLNETHLDSAARAAIDSGDESVVAQFLQLLETHRVRCERSHRYVEAELVRDKIAALRAHEQTARVHALQVRQLAERLDLDQAHVLEFDEFAAAWSRRMDAWDADTRARHQALLTRHVTALEEWTAAQQDQVLLRPKFSKQLLALRAMQESLARTRDYAAAERVRTQAQQLEYVELEALKASWSARAHTQRSRFLEAQARELATWTSRRSEERSKLESLKRTELRASIVQKYANLKSELERVHAKERARLEKMCELGVSDSAVLREEAPRRNNILLPEEVGAGVTAAATGSTGSRRADDSARASAAASTTVGGVSGASNVRAQSAGYAHATSSRRRVEEEEEQMLRELEDVPTIAGTMSARSASRSSTRSSHSATHNGNGTGNGTSAASFAQPLYPQPFSARSHGHSTARAAPSSQQLLQRNAPHRPPPPPQPNASSRPSTSSSYELSSSGRRSVARRVPQPSQAAAHYQRPPPRTLTSRDRDQELAAVLHRGAPPHLLQPPHQAGSAIDGGAGGDGGRGHVRQRSYVERMAARQPTSQKVHSVFHPPLPAISPTQHALLERERQQLEQRRLQHLAMHAQSTHSVSSSDDEF